MPGKPKGPITEVHRVRIYAEDNKVLRNCWVKRNPKGFQTYGSWLRNEMHELAEECRRAGVKPCGEAR